MKPYFYKYLIITMLLLLLLELPAQDITVVWQSVVSNNLTLRAARQQVEAVCAENRAGLAPENPEVEFAYLWNAPTHAGNRIDVSVTQSFDFPTTYLYQNRVANLKNQQATIAFQQQQQELLLTVGEIYYHILYQNVRIEDLQRCGQYLSDVVAAYNQKLDNGSITIFDYNKVKLAELNMRQELAHAEAERASLLLQLKQLNGGIGLEVTENRFPTMRLPADFETWYATAFPHNPTLQWVDNALALQQQQMNLARAAWAPQFMAGYMREQVPSETFQGVKVGLTIPLWQNVNTLKQMKLQSSALALFAADERHKNYTHLQTQYTMAQSLQQQIDEYRALLTSVDSFELLQQALQSGQLSVIDYLSEAYIYHESHERFAELQFDAAKYYLELQLYEIAAALNNR